jgi:polyribonucleotide nucleotidyltransferase
MVGASAALTLSGVPFMGPIGGARVGYINGEYVLNPTCRPDGRKSELDLVVAGTTDAVLMVESEAKELSEDVMLGAVMFGHKSFQPVIDAIIKLAEAAAKSRATSSRKINSAARSRDAGHVGEDLPRPTRSPTRLPYMPPSTPARQGEGTLRTGRRRRTRWTAETGRPVFKSLQAGRPRQHPRDQEPHRRPRSLDRPSDRAKSAFCRVPTVRRCSPAVKRRRSVVATLGTGDDEQYVDSLDGTYKESFMLHYNFPPYSVGETGRTGSPGRREIGHGKLAWRAIHPMLPAKRRVPLHAARRLRDHRVQRLVVDGDRLRHLAGADGCRRAAEAPVAGIAMGLIKEGEEFAVLSDILGDEDHLGDMDFKVAGSEEGVTSLQMDIKITGITEEIMEIALAQAKDGRLHILGEDGQSPVESRGRAGRVRPAHRA